MIKISKKKSIIVIVAIILLIIGAAGFMAYLALWGGHYLVFNVNPASNTITKVVSIEKTGGTLELSDADINGILALETKKGITKDGLTIKKIYSSIEQNHISIYMPSVYKGFNILLYCNGTLAYNNDKIIFTPSVFKLGKLGISNSFVMKKLKGLSNDNISITSSAIEIGKNMIPFDIQTLNMNSNEIVASIQKEQSGNTSSGTTGGKTTSRSNSGGSAASQTDILKRASRQLNGVYASVQTQNEKNIISEIQTTVNRMIQNPSYPYQGEANSVKAQYNKLPEGQRSDLENAILMNMDMTTLRKLKSTFGL